MVDERMKAHFASIATRYDELRSPYGTPHDERLVEVGDLRGQRVLDLGCGTGRLLATLARLYDVEGVGVDASPEMIAVAREREVEGIDYVVAGAEALPFEDACFDRAVTTFAVHHFDRPRVFAEVRRVLRADGCFVISTTYPEAFVRFWMAPLFPSYAEIEQSRFPDGPTLTAELTAAGFGTVAVERFDVLRRFSRQEVLKRLQGRHASSFALMGDEEYHSGLERAEQALPDPVEYTLELLLVRADAG